jgi:hypothetical protein
MQAKHHHEESGGKLGGNRRCARTRGLQFLVDRLHQHPHPVAPSNRSRPQISSVSVGPRVLVLILIALLYSVLIGALLPPCGSRRMLPASSLNVSPQCRSSRQLPLVTM